MILIWWEVCQGNLITTNVFYDFFIGHFETVKILLENGARVDEAALRSVGLANGKGHGIKILGSGEVTKKLSVSAHAFSASARSKIEAKGGTCEVINSKKAETTKA